MRYVRSSAQFCVRYPSPYWNLLWSPKVKLFDGSFFYSFALHNSVGQSLLFSMNNEEHDFKLGNN